MDTMKQKLMLQLKRLNNQINLVLSVVRQLLAKVRQTKPALLEFMEQLWVKKKFFLPEKILIGIMNLLKFLRKLMRVGIRKIQEKNMKAIGFFWLKLIKKNLPKNLRLLIVWSKETFLRS